MMPGKKPTVALYTMYMPITDVNLIATSASHPLIGPARGSGSTRRNARSVAASARSAPRRARPFPVTS